MADLAIINITGLAAGTAAAAHPATPSAVPIDAAFGLLLQTMHMQTEESATTVAFATPSLPGFSAANLLQNTIVPAAGPDATPSGNSLFTDIVAAPATPYLAAANSNQPAGPAFTQPGATPEMPVAVPQETFSEVKAQDGAGTAGQVTPDVSVAAAAMPNTAAITSVNPPANDTAGGGVDAGSTTAAEVDAAATPVASDFSAAAESGAQSYVPAWTQSVNPPKIAGAEAVNPSTDHSATGEAGAASSTSYPAPVESRIDASDPAFNLIAWLQALSQTAPADISAAVAQTTPAQAIPEQTPSIAISQTSSQTGTDGNTAQAGPQDDGRLTTAWNPVVRNDYSTEDAGKTVIPATTAAADFDTGFDFSIDEGASNADTVVTVTSDGTAVPFSVPPPGSTFQSVPPPSVPPPGSTFQSVPQNQTQTPAGPAVIDPSTTVQTHPAGTPTGDSTQPVNLAADPATRPEPAAPLPPAGTTTTVRDTTGKIAEQSATNVNLAAFLATPVTASANQSSTSTQSKTVDTKTGDAVKAASQTDGTAKQTANAEASVTTNPQTAPAGHDKPLRTEAALQPQTGHSQAQPQDSAAAPQHTNAPPPVATVTAALTAAAAAPRPVAAEMQVSAGHHTDGEVTALDKLGLVIAAKSQGGMHQFDIRLDPPELGRLDVRLTVDETGQAQAHLVVDKPQTLELLQRDAASLNRVLTEAGLDLSNNGLNFSLRGQDRQNGGGVDKGRNRTLSAKAAVTAISTTIHSSTGSYAPDSVRLDIRV